MPAKMLIMEKYKAPTRYDKAAYNSLWQYTRDDNGSPSLFVQINDNPQDDAQWIYIGDILAGAYADKVFDDHERSEWIKKYERNKLGARYIT
jgi:hypothetical protein